ncbi:MULTISPECIES: BON domain-containing protein [unclassified Luteimonas]|uniref:BON domain-containing protein n=1 Tax=unclassified Luteimonas TaxID=2629088 RepID=UPI001603B7D0|nr:MULTISPECIES: BON domain-containing protein [unclassified Luteimonas]MBB1472578.1 BON domain-containing protein [Luteimonas sp. MC1782]MBB6598702.1 BON domain-containing protein [Luteimonas sp. MC1825]QOC88871.1 BON domain-containing protein [Luteimonas sp. MC1825]
MTANSKAKNEFKAVAREAAQLGARFVGVTRDWFDNRKQEAERPAGYYSRRTTPGGPADDEERTYGRDEHASTTSTTSSGAGRRSGYRGIGPRGYTRSDERIREDVCEGLCDSDAIDAADINVHVGSGTVRLSGTVPNRAMKHRAEDIAESVSGVRDIENSIRVAGVDPIGGSPSYGSSGSSSGAGMSSAGYGGASASGASATGSAGSTPGGASGHGYGTTPGATTPGGATTGTGTGATPAAGAGTTGVNRPDRAS